jgi:hypothetical protein
MNLWHVAEQLMHRWCAVCTGTPNMPTTLHVVPPAHSTGRCAQPNPPTCPLSHLLIPL